MNTRMLKSALLLSFGALFASPASAQDVAIRADLGPLHIRVLPEAPPPIRYERRPPRPQRGYIWVGGYWDRRGDRWDWVDGRWEAPRRGVYWVAPRYQRYDREWRYDPGHWSNERLVESDEYRNWRERRRHRR